MTVVGPSPDDLEIEEWRASLRDFEARWGAAHARQLLASLARELEGARRRPGWQPDTSDYRNTLAEDGTYPGDRATEARIGAICRWNAVAIVLRANSRFPGIGGHLSTYASAAEMLEVAFNHFFRGHDAPGGGDQIFIQGACAPGIYARAFLEGRLTQAQLDHYRREVVPGRGLSSYSHPRSMPDFWEFPTASMGLGPITAIYQARFNRYLEHRGLRDTSNSRVWAFMGDGETDEPEARGALHVAANEGLDNLTFVVNCNLQRLDGPVRGSGKIIQELEAVFRGAGWNVIKVIWGGDWDDLLARDTDGVLVSQLNRTVDGEFQKHPVAGGAYIREHLFGPDPRLRALVEHLSDDDLANLRRGGHDDRKLYAAYRAATETRGRPTVILAKTVKGWLLGTTIEARNISHQAKRLSTEDLRAFRDRLALPIPDDRLAEVPYYHPGPDSEEVRYLQDRRRSLGGPLPRRIVRSVPLESPQPPFDEEFAAGSQAPASTTMAFARMLRNLVRDPKLGRRVVPIVPDEGRTFGMDALFSELGIYAAHGQRYEPVDADLVLRYREARDGQILEEGITEAGAMASFQAAATSYATHGEPVIPFYIFYSMFGFQRAGDLVWSTADACGRGFLMGATAGQTTLHGEGAQHQDGHSHVLASTNPAVRQYDPAFAYELAVIIRDGIDRMWVAGEDLLYYITLYNQAYVQRRMPRGRQVRRDIIRGMHLLRPADRQLRQRVQLLASGPIVLEALGAQELLAADAIGADVWSVTSFGELRRRALERDSGGNEGAATPWFADLLRRRGGPVIAASDHSRAWPDLIAPWVDQPYRSLGTSGFGLSDTLEARRRAAGIDAAGIADAARAMVDQPSS